MDKKLEDIRAAQLKHSRISKALNNKLNEIKKNQEQRDTWDTKNRKTMNRLIEPKLARATELEEELQNVLAKIDDIIEGYKEN